MLGDSLHYSLLSVFEIFQNNKFKQSLSYIWPDFLLKTLKSERNCLSYLLKYRFWGPTPDLADQNLKMRHKKVCFLTASSVNPPQPSPSVPPADSLRLDDPPDLTLRSCGSQPSRGPSCATCSLRTASAQWWRRASRSRLRGREIMPGDRNSRGRRAQETFPGLDQGLSER